MCTERQDFLPRLARHAVEPEGPHNARRRNDLPILAAESLLVPVGFADDVAPFAAGAEVHLADRHGGAARSPPAANVFGLAVRLEDQTARSVELAGDIGFAIRLERPRP